jgi:hypothetical protein
MSLARLRTCFFFAFGLFVACSAPPDRTTEAFPDTPFRRLDGDPSRLAVELRTAPSQPPTRGSSSAEMTVRDASGALRDDLTLKLTAWMPAHGHGSPTTPSVIPVGNGRYRIDALDLPMAGVWELRLDISGEGGLSDHASTTIEVR